MTSGEIDAEVRRRIEAGEPLYHIDTELIDRLRPDVLITQEHCEVCAVTAKDLDRDACAYAGRTVSLQASTLQEILSGIEAIGAAIECDASAARLVEDVKGRIAAVRAAVADRKPPTVVILEWIDPIFTSGNWVPELVEAANGRLLLGEPGQYSATQTWEAVQAADPDYLIVAPCGFDLERTKREAASLETLPRWFQLRAVLERHVVLADGNKYCNRSGITVADTAEMLAEILHGYGSKYRGNAWRPYSVPVMQGEIARLHDEACARRQTTYCDPVTGYTVFTEFFLRQRGTCCDKGCRHCPYTLVGVSSPQRRSS